ncbi:head-tail joining protein [Undibacterium sp. Di26W]|uniref:head-tail joining protein n=1 Tax=Undibacterium sp. Di26W TaxID=3413035 RepID=UPI003BEFD3DA
MDDPFARMTKSIFAQLGGDAFLRGTEPCSIEISHGVEVVTPGEYSDIVAHRTVANISYEDLPKPQKNDVISVGGTEYHLDALLKDDGYSARWVVL